MSGTAEHAWHFSCRYGSSATIRLQTVSFRHPRPAREPVRTTMAYFVTGASGFIGRHLVRELLRNREGDVFVLVRSASRSRMERLVEGWGQPARVTLVLGDLEDAALGVDRGWVKNHRGSIDHFFHLAAVRDTKAPTACDEPLDVGATRNA